MNEPHSFKPTDGSATILYCTRCGKTTVCETSEPCKIQSGSFQQFLDLAERFTEIEQKVRDQMKMVEDRVATLAADVSPDQAMAWFLSDQLREQLAAYAHEAWSGWMRYLFNECGIESIGETIISSDLVNRWQRQMKTPYAELPENEKDSDRKEADKMLAILRGEVWHHHRVRSQTDEQGR